jgi:suppressor for copper-sensitivity B
VTLTLAPLGVFAIYTMVGLGMGLPFLVLCLRPSLVKRLPKPGAWMETLKEALAFPLLLTVIYFVAGIGEEYRIATLSTLIAVWFGCWLIGKVPAYARRSLKAQAWSAAIVMIAAWGFISFTFLGPSKSELPWQPYSPDRLATLRDNGKTVMIDFTANWCVNCQWNTLTAIEKPRVAAVLEKNDVVPLLADWTEPSEAIESHMKRLGVKTIPLLVIYPADRSAEPIVLKDVITEKMVIEALKQAGPSQTPSKMASTTGEPSSETL